ncbi:MAG: carbohydrate-binding family 9-like protein, partial [Armatimonadota bacterium]
VFVMALCLSAVFSDGIATVRIGRFDAAPQINGTLDDPCWDSAAVAGPFVLHNGTGLPTQQTYVKLGWDDRALYLGFTCYERSLAPMTQQLHLLKAEARTHDGSVFADESVEIFLRPGGSGDYFQLAANMIGTRYESCGMDAGFDADWQAEATHDETAWYLEIAVPFEAVCGPTPQPGDTWTVNFCRNEHPRDEHSTWSGLTGGFHNATQFGELIFDDITAGVMPLDLADLAPSAPALRLKVSGDQSVTGNAIVKSDRERTSSAESSDDMLTIPYPAGGGGAAQVKYEVALADGTLAYRSPWFPQAGATVEIAASIRLTGGSGVLLHNGEEWAELADGETVSLQRHLETGKNVIGLKVPGGVTVSGELHSDTQAFDFARGWRWSDAEVEGWDQPGFDAYSFEPLEADGHAFTAPESDAVVLRRVIAVPDKRERFWPVEAGLNLPRKSEMFVKPLLNWVGEVPGDYTYCIDLPAPIKIIAHDNLDGVPLAPMEETSITRDGRPYTRYRLSPVGSLISGFTLELLWKNEAGTQSQYVSALSFGGTFDWREFEVEVTSPPFGELVGVLPLKWQKRGISGTCWYDDIELIEKETGKNLLPQGNFEGELKDAAHVGTYQRNGGKNHALKLWGTEDMTNQQMGLWVTPPTLQVKPDTRYILRVRAKGEDIKGKDGTARASLLANVGSPNTNRLTAYSHYESLGGHIVEAEQASPINILPEMQGHAPDTVPIIVCYASSAYENPQFKAANAQMVRDAGINWLWGSNQSDLAQRLRPEGMKFVWHIPRRQYDPHPIDDEYLKRHPDHRALQKNGALNDHQICPTVVLDTDNEFIPALKEWFADRLSDNPYDMIDWDHEFPLDRINSICFCERCRTKFAEYAGLDEAPPRAKIFEDHADAWINFRCEQNARMAAILRDACKAVLPDTPFSVYSGYQTPRTMSLYGVDWRKMADSIDWGIAGYNGGQRTIQNTMEALGGLPFTSGCMYVEKRFTAERPYPQPMAWRMRLMRAMLDDEGGGFLIWYLPNLDGAGYWGISWVSALVAQYEEFFEDFNRRDDTVVTDPEISTDRLAVLQHNRERLIILMNPK